MLHVRKWDRADRTAQGSDRRSSDVGSRSGIPTSFAGEEREHRTALAPTDRARGRRISRDVAATAHERFVARDRKAVVALEAVLLQMNLRQVVPDAQEVRIAVRIDQREHFCR